MSADQAREQFPEAFRRVIDTVLPERKQKARKGHRDNWWLFGEKRPQMRAALAGLPRFIAICRTAKYFIFQFVPGDALAESKVVAIASDDALVLGLLSSRCHLVWSVVAGSHHGVGNDLTYNNSRTFDTFPFPATSPAIEAGIRALGESLDEHRASRQAEYPDLTLTDAYNVLAKLRSGEPLDNGDRVVHEKGLVSVLKKLHDDLDAAVFGAYGWPVDLPDEEVRERLLALNAERAEEEAKGLIRWLRPEFQNPAVSNQQIQTKFTGIETEEDEHSDGGKDGGKTTWPRRLPDQIVTLRGALQAAKRSFSAPEAAKLFKGAKLTEVEAVLESLASLGLVLSFETGGIRRWRSGGRQV